MDTLIDSGLGGGGGWADAEMTDESFPPVQQPDDHLSNMYVHSVPCLANVAHLD